MVKATAKDPFTLAIQEVATLAAGWGSVPMRTAEVGDWLERFLGAEVCCCVAPPAPSANCGVADYGRAC